MRMQGTNRAGLKAGFDRKRVDSCLQEAKGKKLRGGNKLRPLCIAEGDYDV